MFSDLRSSLFITYYYFLGVENSNKKKKKYFHYTSHQLETHFNE